MRTLYIIILLVSSFNSFCQNKTKSNFTRKIIISYSDSIIEANMLTRNKDIKINDRVNYYWYHSNRINSNRGGYSGKLLHGKYQVLNKVGELISMGEFAYGLKCGEWKYWHKDGEIKSQGTFSDGFKIGDFKYYNSSGKIIDLKKYKKGVLHGNQYNFVDGKQTVKKYRRGKEIIKTPKEKKNKEEDKKITKEEMKENERVKEKIKDKSKDLENNSAEDKSNFFNRLLKSNKEEKETNIKKESDKKSTKRKKKESKEKN